MAALLKPARGQELLAPEQARAIRKALLQWTDVRVSKGKTVEELNRELNSAGLFAPETLLDGDVVGTSFAGYLGKITSEPVRLSLIHI